MQGWVDLVGWLCTEGVYPPEDGHHPSTNRAQRRATSFMWRTMLPLRGTANQYTIIYANRDHVWLQMYFLHFLGHQTLLVERRKIWLFCEFLAYRVHGKSARGPESAVISRIGYGRSPRSWRLNFLRVLATESRRNSPNGSKLSFIPLFLLQFINFPDPDRPLPTPSKIFGFTRIT